MYHFTKKIKPFLKASFCNAARRPPTTAVNQWRARQGGAIRATEHFILETCSSAVNRWSDISARTWVVACVERRVVFVWSELTPWCRVRVIVTKGGKRCGRQSARGAATTASSRAWRGTSGSAGGAIAVARVACWCWRGSEWWLRR